MGMKKVLLAVGCCAAKLLVGAVFDGSPSVESAARDSELVESLFAERCAAEISGDELAAALHDLPWEGVSSNVWREVHRRLAGRELTFSDVTFSGFDQTLPGAQDHSRVILVPSPLNKMFGMMRRGIVLRVSLPTNVSERIGWMQSQDAVRSVVGTVLAPDEVGTRGFCGLHMRGTELVPKDAPPPPLPDVDSATITGDEVLGLLVNLPRRLAYVEELQRKLVGRELTFTNLVLSLDVWERKNAGYDILLGEKADVFRLSASFPTSFVERVSWLEKGDRIARLTGRIPALPKNKVGLGLFLEGLDIVVETPKPEPLPELIDLTKMTGDDLLARIPHLRKSQLNDLEHGLEGRELTFHDLSFTGMGSRSGNQRHFFFKAQNKLSDDAALSLRVTFDDPERTRMVERMWDRGTLDKPAIRELRGRVESSEKDYWGRSSGVLVVKGTDVVLNAALEPIPDFDAKTITGDGVVKLVQSFKQGCGPYVRDIAEQLVGRTLTFTNVLFDSFAYQDGGIARLDFRIDRQIPLSTNSWQTDSLYLLTKVNAAELDALPWGLTRNDRILRLTGRVGAMTRNDFGFRYQGIFLEDATFEVPWKNVKLPHFDAKTITGDEFVRMAASFDSFSRQAKIQRMLRMMKGRRLMFSRCFVARGETCVPTRNGAIRVNLDFGKMSDWDDSNRCLIPITLSGAAGKRAFRELAMNVQLTNVSGVVRWAEHQPWEDKYGDTGFRLTDVDYTLVQPTEALPDFDAATITGDELVDMIARRKTALTPWQRETLQTKLDGRRLFFTKVRFDGRIGSNGVIFNFNFLARNASDWRRTDCRMNVALKNPLAETEEERIFDRMGSYRVTATIRAKPKDDELRGRIYFLGLDEGEIECLDEAK